MVGLRFYRNHYCFCHISLQETGRKVVTSPEETKPEREGVRVEVEGEEEGGGKNEEGEKRASEDVSGRGEKQETEDSMIGMPAKILILIFFYIRDLWSQEL